MIGILATVSLTFTLGACGQKSSTSDDAGEKTTTMSDILNGKEERKIVMTKDTRSYDSADVEWAGTIGKGKVNIRPYMNMQGFEFNDLRGKSMSEFKKILNEKDKEYKKLKNNKKLKNKIKTQKAKIYLQSSPEKNTADYLVIDYKAPYYTEDENYTMTEMGLSEINTKHNKNWLSIQTQATSKEIPEIVYVEAKNGEKNLAMEDIKKAKKNYKNVEVVK